MACASRTAGAPQSLPFNRSLRTPGLQFFHPQNLVGQKAKKAVKVETWSSADSISCHQANTTNSRVVVYIVVQIGERGRCFNSTSKASHVCIKRMWLILTRSMTSQLNYFLRG